MSNLNRLYATLQETVQKEIIKIYKKVEGLQGNFVELRKNSLKDLEISKNIYNDIKKIDKKIGQINTNAQKPVNTEPKDDETTQNEDIETTTEDSVNK